MTTTQNPNHPTTVETIDPNSRRPILWNVDDIIEEDGTIAATEDGWTHFFVMTRPKGRKSWTMFVRMNDAGEIIRHSTPKVGF